jgi:hypothetical protein
VQADTALLEIPQSCQNPRAEPEPVENMRPSERRYQCDVGMPRSGTSKLCLARPSRRRAADRIDIPRCVPSTRGAFHPHLLVTLGHLSPDDLGQAFIAASTLGQQR